METFSSPLERTAAKALLLLSSSKPLSPPSYRNKCKEDQHLSVYSSCSSSLTSNDSSEEIRPDPLRILAIAALYLEKKFKVVRRTRSKIYRASHSRKFISGWSWKVSRPVPEKEENSVISSTSSSVCSVVSRRQLRVMKKSSTRRENVFRGGKREGWTYSARLRSRAEAILEFLSGCWASEVRIREAFGNSPDTSKALRMLLKLEEVKRSGAGGRVDPFLYSVVGPRSDVDSV
ncbi:uncharacterized protein LOC143852336 [Tasmannia lanceolata]|uniref:uncharacterized protein LOC143852336 n=1 Tax=Tasmannia lanceolata TaxID=3420 RepID=UPI0040642195